MLYLLQAAFCVGVIGAVIAVPLLCVVHFQGLYLSVGSFLWSSPAVLFFLAAISFGTTCSLLPATRWRTRTAGLGAVILTFFGFASWMAIAINVRPAEHEA